MQEQVQHFLEDVLDDYVTAATAEGHPEDWDLEQLWTTLKTVYPVSIDVEEVVEQAGGLGRVTPELLKAELLSDARIAYEERTTSLGEANMRQLERRVVLSVLDRKWREHLYEMDYLKEGIGLRAMAQRDPLIEYQREGYQLFQAMTDAIKEEAVGYLFNLEVKVAEPAPGAGAEGAAAPAAGEAGIAGAVGAAAAVGAPPVLVAKGIDGPDRQVPLQYSAPSVDGDSSTTVSRGRRAAGPATSAPAGAAASDGAAGADGATGAGEDAGNREARRKAAKQQRRRG
jgi:preprotein translocase subunit SecA